MTDGGSDGAGGGGDTVVAKSGELTISVSAPTAAPPAAAASRASSASDDAFPTHAAAPASASSGRAMAGVSSSSSSSSGSSTGSNNNGAGTVGNTGSASAGGGSAGGGSGSGKSGGGQHHRRGSSISTPFISPDNPYAVSERVAAERARAQSERERELQRSIKISAREKRREVESIRARFYGEIPVDAVVSAPATASAGSGTPDGSFTGASATVTTPSSRATAGFGVAAASSSSAAAATAAAAGAGGAGAGAGASAADVNGKHKRKLALLADIHAAELRLEKFGRETVRKQNSLSALKDAAAAGTGAGAGSSSASDSRDSERLKEYEKLFERQNAYITELAEELQASQLRVKQLLQWKKVAFEHVDILRAENDELVAKLKAAAETYQKLRLYRRLFKALAARSFLRLFQVKRQLRGLHHTFSRLLEHVSADQRDEPKRHIFTLQAEIEEWLGIGKRINPSYTFSAAAAAAAANAAAAGNAATGDGTDGGAHTAVRGRWGSVRVGSIIRHLTEAESVLHTAIVELMSQKEQWKVNIDASEARSLQLTTALAKLDAHAQRIGAEHDRVLSQHTQVVRNAEHWQRRAEVAQHTIASAEEREAKLMARVSSLSRQNAYLQQQIRLLVHSGHVSHTIIHNPEQAKAERAQEKRDTDAYREQLRSKRLNPNANANASTSASAAAPVSTADAAGNGDVIDITVDGDGAAADVKHSATGPAGSNSGTGAAAGGGVSGGSATAPAAAGGVADPFAAPAGKRASLPSDLRQALASFHAHHGIIAPSPMANSRPKTGGAAGSSGNSGPGSPTNRPPSAAAGVSATPAFMWRHIPHASNSASGVSAGGPAAMTATTVRVSGGGGALSPRKQKLRNAAPPGAPGYTRATAASTSGATHVWGDPTASPPPANGNGSPRQQPQQQIGSGGHWAAHTYHGPVRRDDSDWADRSSSPVRSAGPNAHPQTKVKLLAPRVILDPSGLDPRVKAQKIANLVSSPYMQRPASASARRPASPSPNASKPRAANVQSPQPPQHPPPQREASAPNGGAADAGKS